MFSRDLKDRTESESGWIFAQGGPIYIAYRPFAPGEWRPVDWTGLLKGGAGGWFSTNFEELAAGSEFYVSESLNNGYIVQVAPTADFDSMQSFQQAITDLPLSVSLDPVPTVSFTGLDGSELKASYGKELSVDGKTIRYDDWRLFDGPFSQADRASEKIEIIHGNERLTLDFKNTTSTTTFTPDR